MTPLQKIEVAFGLDLLFPNCSNELKLFCQQIVSNFILQGEPRKMLYLLHTVSLIFL